MTVSPALRPIRLGVELGQQAPAAQLDDVVARRRPGASACRRCAPSKSMTTKSPGSAARSTGTRRDACSRSALSSASSAPSGTSTSARPTSRPVYSPSVASGRTWTVAWKVRSPASGTLSRSRSGSSIGLTPGLGDRLRSTSSPSDPLSISCTTASRPTRWTITSAGALPGRNPGTRTSRPSWRMARSMPRWTSSSGTATSRRTLFSSSGVTSAVSVICTPASPRVGCMRVRGLEPPWVAPLGPKPSASTGFATPARYRRRGVNDGIRTHDRLDHNQELYQLSYVHRETGRRPAPGA